MFKRLLTHLALFAFRGISIAAKFLLALYTVRFLGLSDLGLYGLVTAAATLSPALLGFGLTEWTARQVAEVGTEAAAIQAIQARLSTSIAAHVVLQPLFWIANYALGSPIPLSWAWLIALIVLLEHLASDLHDLLIARSHIRIASVLQFTRAALWPIGVVTIGILVPPTRTLHFIFAGWLLGLLLTSFVAVAWLIAHGHGIAVNRIAFLDQIRNARASTQLYARNITATAGLYLDRYVISLTLGLELTGAYVFFWSVVNVVHGMIMAVIIQPQAGNLVRALSAKDTVLIRSVERQLGLDAIVWTVAMSVAVFGVVSALLPLLERESLEQLLPLLGLMLIAGWARIAADGFGFVLLARHDDRAVLLGTSAGVCASALLNVALIPWYGLWGAGLAFFLTGVVVLLAAWSVKRA